MTGARRRVARDVEPGWLASLLGAVLLVAGGFGLGLVAGVVAEEPELVIGHLVGRSESVDWLPDAAPEDSSPSDAGILAERGTGPDLGSDEGGARRDGEAAARLPDVAAGPAARSESAPPRKESWRPAAPRSISELPRSSGRPATSRTGGGFAVQVGAFSDEGAAVRIRDGLSERGFDAYLVPAARAGDGRSRVRVGPVPSRADAEALAGRLKLEERLPTWVLEVDPE